MTSRGGGACTSVKTPVGSIPTPVDSMSWSFDSPAATRAWARTAISRSRPAVPVEPTGGPAPATSIRPRAPEAPRTAVDTANGASPASSVRTWRATSTMSSEVTGCTKMSTDPLQPRPSPQTVESSLPVS